jgi:hypothetical protein
VVRTTGGVLVRRVGRLVLWVAVLIVGARGVAASFAASPYPAAPVVKRAVSWPDDRVGAFAAQFAAAWLAVTPDATAYRAGVEPFLDESGLSVLPVADGDARPVSVGMVTVASLERVSGSSARVTVAAVTSAGRVWLACRVDRDDSGRLVVVGAPALVAAPERAHAEQPDGSPLPSGLSDAVELADRFVSAYVTGHPEALAYLVPAGAARPAALPAGLAVAGDVEVSGVGNVGDAARRVVVLARVTVSDHARARRTLAYRLVLQRSDRWYVMSIGGGA